MADEATDKENLEVENAQNGDTETQNGQEKTKVETKAEELGTDAETLQKAMDLGYNPDFEGDGSKTAKTPEQFLELQPLYDDLRKKNRELKKYKQDIDALKDSHKMIAKRTYERARQDLQKEKKQAVEEGEGDKVVELDDKISELDKEYNEQEQKTSQNNDTAMQESFQEWLKSNPWYENDPDLKETADAIGAKLQNDNPDIINDPEKFLSQVTEKIKKVSPDKFSKKRTNAVEGDKGGGGGAKKKYSIRSLPEEDQKVAKRIVDSGVMTEEEYCRQYMGEQ